MNLNEENKFIEEIDCNFPYDHKDQCLLLIDRALQFSPNAVFSVVEELCRIPVSKRQKVSAAFLFDLLNIINQRFVHPLKEIIFDVANKMIENQEISVDDAISKMKEVKKVPRQYAALSILYFSCDDKTGRLDPVWTDIISEWQQMNG